LLQKKRVQITETNLKGVLVIKPDVFKDNRGYFYESFNAQKFREHNLDITFVQDNQSMSGKNILRGLHFQVPPFAQGKLVRVIKGSVLDVAVDLRKDSQTYGENYTVVLSEENFLQLWIPPGFAHGFLTLDEETIFAYKCTNYYNKEFDHGIMWNDPDLAINWGIRDPVLSEKDKTNIPFTEFVSPF
jgi:dTDP-4-dehydrorhamnose 3,5-epimerase